MLEGSQAADSIEDRGISWSVHRLATVDSTNLAALRLARQGATSGAVVVARGQTAGRGRLGRGWADLPGQCLLMSVLLDPPGDGTALLTPAMALAAAEAIEQLAQVASHIKWPNDLMITGRKVAGVLAEGPADGPVAVGLGVNVNGLCADLPEDLHRRAVFVSEAAGREIEIRELETAVLSHLHVVYRDLARGERSDLIDSLNRRDYLAGREVSVRFGRDRIRGIAGGWLPDGRLLLHTEDGGDVRLVAGEVTID